MIYILKRGPGISQQLYTWNVYQTLTDPEKTENIEADTPHYRSFKLHKQANTKKKNQAHIL